MHNYKMRLFYDRRNQTIDRVRLRRYNHFDAVRYYKEASMSEQPEGRRSFDQEARDRLIELSRKVLLAGLGAAALAQDEMERFIQLLVERGELAEKEARQMIREILDRRDQIMRERKAEGTPQPAAATKADIEALSAKITELNKKIEELRKQKAG